MSHFSFASAKVQHFYELRKYFAKKMHPTPAFFLLFLFFTLSHYNIHIIDLTSKTWQWNYIHLHPTLHVLYIIQYLHATDTDIIPTWHNIASMEIFLHNIPNNYSLPTIFHPPPIIFHCKGISYSK